MVYLENTLIPEKGIYNPLQSEYGTTPDGQDYLRYDYTYDAFLDKRTETSFHIDESEYNTGKDSYIPSGISKADLSDYNHDGLPELLIQDNSSIYIYDYVENEVTEISVLHLNDYKPSDENTTYTTSVQTFDDKDNSYLLASYYGSHSDVSIHAHFELISLPDMAPVKSITFEGLSNQEAPQEEWYTDVTTHNYATNEDNSFTATVAEFSPNDNGMKVDDSYLISQGFLNESARDVDNLNFLQTYYYKIPESASETELLFTELNNQNMTYWSDPRSSSSFTFQPDGSFEFISNYMNGMTMENYISGFKGQFTNVHQIDDYTWELTLEDWSPLYDEHDETDENGNVIHYSTGITTSGDRGWFDGGTYYLYLPGAKADAIPYDVSVGSGDGYGADGAPLYYYIIDHYVLYREGDTKAYAGDTKYWVDTSNIDMSAHDEDNP